MTILIFGNHFELLGTLTVRHAVPTIFSSRDFVAAGGLIAYGASGAYLGHMVLRTRTRPKPQPRVSKFAHDAALHFLARPKQYPLIDAERADLVQVVEGYTSPHDHVAARRGIERMREHYRRLGQTPRF